MREPASNENVERLLQARKQALGIVSINEGMEIDRSEGQFSNAEPPMVRSDEPDSNDKCERGAQDLKHELEMTSIDEGTQIDWRERPFRKLNSGLETGAGDHAAIDRKESPRKFSFVWP
jgi:hypothetical protein